MTPEMAAECEEHIIQSEAAGGEYGRERAQDILDQDISLMPGGSGSYGSRFIGKKKGVLLANKQIYEETTTVLFGKNLFIILPEYERVWAFWRCDSMKCEPIGKPCYVRGVQSSLYSHLNDSIS